MKSFKKILSVFLVIICIFGMISTAAFAIDGIIGGIIGDDLTMEPDEDEALTYGVHYEIDTASGVSVMYKPSPDIEFNVPSKVKVTSDVPLAVDYECYAWRDASYNYYYAGEEITVEIVTVNKKMTGIYPACFGSTQDTLIRTNICIKYTPNDRFDSPITAPWELSRSKHISFTSRNTATE